MAGKSSQGQNNVGMAVSNITETGFVWQCLTTDPGIWPGYFGVAMRKSQDLENSRWGLVKNVWCNQLSCCQCKLNVLYVLSMYTLQEVSTHYDPFLINISKNDKIEKKNSKKDKKQSFAICRTIDPFKYPLFRGVYGRTINHKQLDFI